jgi:hypothetical protein
VHLASQEPVQLSVAPAFAVHPPLHSTESEPPVHTGGFALKSHLAVPEHFAWQSSFALTDAEQTGGTMSIFSWALPLTVPICVTASWHQAFIAAFLSVVAVAAS